MALREVASVGKPDVAKLRALVAHLEPQACADAYLDWFELVLAKRRGA